MTPLRLSDDHSGIAAADVLILPVFADRGVPGGLVPAVVIDHASGLGVLSALQHLPRFSATLGEVAPVVVRGGTEKTAAVLAVGLGERSALSTYALRVAAQMAAAATLGYRRIVSLLAIVGEDRIGAMRAAVEGMLLGRHQPPGAPAAAEAGDLVILAPLGLAEDASLRRAFDDAQIVAGWANWVRRLVDLPPCELTPAILAGLVAEEAGKRGVQAEIWDRTQMLAQQFGGTAAVGAGSAAPPQVVVLRTSPRPGRPPLGLAGKGMTFDSGGINLKRSLSEIARMKDDMAGAASVAAALFAAIDLGATPDVIAVLPMAENMPSGTAQRPGDILHHPGALRSEIIDTDCEGRLILADAIAYLESCGVAGIVDVGTLTDGGGVGPLLWGCWANDDRLAAAVLAAGEAAGEPGWRLPLRDEYRQLLPSRVADIANAPLSHPDIGLTAATYLRAFIGNTPWVHIDNGSSAYLEQAMGPWPAGPTGSPMRALLQLLLDRN